MFFNKDWEMGVSASDFHKPFENKKAVDLLEQFLSYYQPRYFVINGDLVDFWEISKYDKTPRTGQELKDELAGARELLARFRRILPKSEIIFIEGNHEFRLKKYIISNAPALYGLEGLNISDQLHLEELKIKYIACNEAMARWDHTYYKIGHLHIGHFNKVNKHAGYTAKCLLEDLGVSLIQGHTHRFGVSAKSTMDNNDAFVSVEQGCMCDLHPKYLSFANWQNGFAVFYKKKSTKRFQVYPTIIFDNKFFFGDKEFN